MERLGLSEKISAKLTELSGGQQQRLMIVRALMHEPEIIFLDEPTVGLDPVARRAVWTHLSELRRQSGMTMFLTTHYMEEADSLCNRVAIMHQGRVAAIGAPDELKAALGGENPTLDDVFMTYTGDALESGGSYRDTSRARRTARRVG